MAVSVKSWGFEAGEEAAFINSSDARRRNIKSHEPPQPTLTHRPYYYSKIKHRLIRNHGKQLQLRSFALDFNDAFNSTQFTNDILPISLVSKEFAQLASEVFYKISVIKIVGKDWPSTNASEAKIAGALRPLQTRKPIRHMELIVFLEYDANGLASRPDTPLLISTS
ncbi:hypothetical protein K458DRAFT_387071 [Lentithecium fluviatile CBS 122367]|uniref:Uncharacterized protein n=1 Tax=Lentithecium fluviatile CBS 122367 TaxID=1168545 RepID=A0A6G1J7G2_9PLEO|nr:hypothetical protein K458DRAFT_387071 [Lentithecium fluviatile CBS 122367]